MKIETYRQSTLRLPASEVVRLAIETKANIERSRTEAIRDMINVMSNMRVPRFGGLFSSLRYPSREVAEQSPAVQLARQSGYGDYETCELMQKAAQWLIDNVAPEHQFLNVTIEDFRALA